MFNKKSFASAIISLATVFALIGCSSSGGTGTGGTGGSSTEPTKSASPSPTEAKQETIEFWAWAPNAEEWKELEQKFAAKYPNIKVNFSSFSSQDYAQKIKIAIQSGTAPDVMGFELANAPKYVSALEPLAPFAEKAWGKDWKGMFKQEPLKQVEGLNYRLLPTGISATPVIVYNVDMFKKVGVEPPKTLDELKAVLKKFEDAKLEGVIPRLGFPGGKDSSFNDFFFNIVNQVAPGKLYQAAENKIPFTDPDILKAAQMFKSFYTDKIVQDGNLTIAFSPQLTDLFFKNKQFPMIVVGGWTVNWIKQFQDSGNYGVIPVPSVNGSKPVVQVNADLPLGINKDSKKKDAAWKFIEFMTMGDYQQIEAKSLLFLPVKKGMTSDNSLLKADISKAGADLVVELAEKNSAGVRFMPYPELTQGIYLNMQKMATGELTPDAALKEIQKVSEKIER
ncbi:ABC transporter substrate-binding protein [Paenibacillus koleovorans]|uniref:ABC transporter substrate-binding protein n=1 Tax=Paenibacillus koleovorans TaxID=121608 RepID=UPI000FD9B5CB|nr:sugar ABC transporter substrate-binding protein [Paenibacillus koleovorans]